MSHLTEVKKWNNRAVIKANIDKTFSLRRRDIVAKESEVEELKERWPALYTPDEMASYLLLTTTGSVMICKVIYYPKNACFGT